MERSRSSQKVASINKQIADKKEKMTNRMSRLLWQSQDLHTNYIVSSPSTRSLTSQQSDMENPLVVGSIIVAGVFGVVIIAVIIIGMWIRSRLVGRDEDGNRKSISGKDELRRTGHVDVDTDAIIMMSSISSSTLDTDEIQMPESLDDTALTFYSANDTSLTNEGISEDNNATDDCTFCDVHLSPI